MTKEWLKYFPDEKGDTLHFGDTKITHSDDLHDLIDELAGLLTIIPDNDPDDHYESEHGFEYSGQCIYFFHQNVHMRLTAEAISDLIDDLYDAANDWVNKQDEWLTTSSSSNYSTGVYYSVANNTSSGSF